MGDLYLPAGTNFRQCPSAPALRCEPASVCPPCPCAQGFCSYIITLRWTHLKRSTIFRICNSFNCLPLVHLNHPGGDQCCLGWVVLCFLYWVCVLRSFCHCLCEPHVPAFKTWCSLLFHRAGAGIFLPH